MGKPIETILSIKAIIKNSVLVEIEMNTIISDRIIVFIIYNYIGSYQWSSKLDTLGNKTIKTCLKVKRITARAVHFYYAPTILWRKYILFIG